MMKWDEFTKNHVRPNALLIVADAENLRADGFVGSGALRDTATVWHKETDLTLASCIRATADEAYRQLALDYIKSFDKTCPMDGD